MFASAAPLVSTGPGKAESGLCQQPRPASPLSAAVDRERVYQYARRAAGRVRVIAVALVGRGIWLVLLSGGPWMCGQGHKQSGSLKVGAKTLS